MVRNMYHCFRLKKGNDLKKELESFAIKNKISGVILCCVGCLDKLNIRLADAKDYLIEEKPFEIVSATGTLSKDGMHIFNEFYIVKKDINLSKIILQEEEVQDIKWVPKEEILKRINHNYDQLTDKISYWRYLEKYLNSKNKIREVL